MSPPLPSDRTAPPAALEGITIVSTALNLPGPLAVARLAGLGATVYKIEPPTGDPLAQYDPDWYRELNRHCHVRVLDLKDAVGRMVMAEWLQKAHVLLTAQRPMALARMGLGALDLQPYPSLSHVAIVGHAAEHADRAGHDLTYAADAGLIVDARMPVTLMADMAGSERAVSAVLEALLVWRQHGQGTRIEVALADVAEHLAQPRQRGLTATTGQLGGACATYRIYPCRNGAVALAALEPRFVMVLENALAGAPLNVDNLSSLFASRDVRHWQAWAIQNDVPLAIVMP
jgi:crotonobetainyl-CoA:carnitine CoA-transferase CaiB-like acyl-CoA transferase